MTTTPNTIPDRAELPPLPKAAHVVHTHSELGDIDLFTVDQMHAHALAARSLAGTPGAGSDACVVASDAFLCRAWGETELTSAELVADWDGVRRFMVREWLGREDQTDDDGENTLDRFKADFDEHEQDERGGAFSCEFEIGGVSVERVVGFAPPADAAPPKAEPLKAAPDAVSREFQLLQVENAGLQSSVGHLGALVDELRGLTQRCIKAMSTLHSAAEPDENTEDIDARIPAHDFAVFVNEHAAMLHAFAHHAGMPTTQQAAKSAEASACPLGLEGSACVCGVRVCAACVASDAAAHSAAPAAVGLTDEQVDAVMRVCINTAERYAFVGDAAFPRGREKLKRALSALAAPSTGQDAAQAVDAARLDYLQAQGVTVEILLGDRCDKGRWKFRVGGFYGSVSHDIREALDAALAAQGDGGTTA